LCRFIIAIVAAAFGFGEIAAGAAGIAKILFPRVRTRPQTRKKDKGVIRRSSPYSITSVAPQALWWFYRIPFPAISVTACTQTDMIAAVEATMWVVACAIVFKRKP